MPRKTVNVRQLIDTANFFLANNDPAISEEQRKGVAGMAESILTAADAYAGFHYIDGYQGVESYKRHYYIKG